MRKIKEMNEKELRNFKAIWPKTQKELLKHVYELTNRKHDYGTCVYAVSLASVAMFHYMSGKLGITGFQASCADLDILSRTRSMKDGFMILDYNHLLYPQYLDLEHFPAHQKLILKNKDNLKKKAKKLLKESPTAHADVRKHWEYIASL